ncbi:MAG: response regulator transcription factor [Sulfurimonas sp.]|nr:response regulator transcription factor [Sulfurimonas sp.]
MKKIILFTNMSSIQKHWQSALDTNYNTILIDKLKDLIEYLDTNDNSIIILLDEMSTSNIENTLSKLKSYSFVKILIFNAVPDVHHASTLLDKGIKGYENSFIHKDNLLKMLISIENGNSWLFPQLTNYIINKYVQNNSKNEPEFVKSLTEKEKNITFMIADGLSNKEIIQKEKIALSTVKGHISHIFEKAGVSDRVSLALKFK